MPGGAWRGAAIGFAVGVALVGLLILLPSAVQGSFYEITDSLLVLGVPLVVVATAVGVVVGASGRRALTDRSPTAPLPPSRLVLIGAAALGVCVLAGLLFLSGTGILRLH
ncbi:hypothetical protein GCM10020369_72570 [Cryptosporangium minutisporangium]|uniref:Uncharacterized protein n=1 Tax=Cryptosporangium minutisporangium TaxID=113569 RepID=A0ABP6T8W2_9ACTN